MFEEMLAPFMVFIVLCFIGLMVMFFFIMRGFDELVRNLRTERSVMLEQVRAIEDKIDILTSVVRNRRVSSDQSEGNGQYLRRPAMPLSEASRPADRHGHTDSEDNITEFILHE